MRVRLRKKLADVIDGVDLKSRKVGDVFDVSQTEGRLLFAEEWAIPERRSVDRGKEDQDERSHPPESRQRSVAIAHDRSRSARAKAKKGKG